MEKLRKIERISHHERDDLVSVGYFMGQNLESFFSMKQVSSTTKEHSRAFSHVLHVPPRVRKGGILYSIICAWLLHKHNHRLSNLKH